MQTKLHPAAWSTSEEPSGDTMSTWRGSEKRNSLQQQVREAKQRWQQVLEQHQGEIKEKDEELQQVKEQNAQLIREKDRITQEHIQEMYLTNLHLHQRTTTLEGALQMVETLLREPAQQIRELEEVPKVSVSPDEQLETEHKLIMEASSNLVS